VNPPAQSPDLIAIKNLSANLVLAIRKRSISNKNDLKTAMEATQIIKLIKSQYIKHEVPWTK